MKEGTRARLEQAGWDVGTNLVTALVIYASAAAIGLVEWRVPYVVTAAGVVALELFVAYGTWRVYQKSRDDRPTDVKIYLVISLFLMFVGIPFLVISFAL